MKADPQAAAAAMGWLAFLASVIGSVAWPAAALTLATIFRTQIVALLERVSRVSFAGSTVELDRRFASAEIVAEVAAPESAAETLDDQTVQLVSVAPLSAINESWARLDIKLHSLAASSSIAVKERWRTAPQFAHLVRALRSEGLISAPTELLLQNIYWLRHELVTGGNVSTDEAVRFIALTDKAKALIDGSDVRPDSPE